MKETIFPENTVFTLSETPCAEDHILSFPSITIITKNIKRQTKTNLSSYET